MEPHLASPAGTATRTSARDRGRHLRDLESELDRGRRTGSSLAVAYSGVIGLKSINATELMARVTAGSVPAFAEIYDRYCDRAYRVARSVCREHGRAEEAVQEAFLTVWRSSGSYRSERGSVSAWLLTMVRHRAIDLARRNGSHEHRRASEGQLANLPGSADPSEEVISRDDVARLRASLEKLPDAQHEVITLAFFGELSHVEIATQLGLPPGTVKGRMRLGMQKLSATLTRSMTDES